MQIIVIADDDVKPLLLASGQLARTRNNASLQVLSCP